MIHGKFAVVSTIVVAAILMISCGSANGQTSRKAENLIVFNDGIQVGPHTTARFAGASAGRKILTTKDDFVDRMSPFDRSARLKTDQDVSTDQYLEYVGQAVLEWDPSDRETIRQVIAESRHLLSEWNLPLPPEIMLIKTTGDEEGGAPHTRSSAIVFPQAVLSRSTAQLSKTFFHELFHILSRFNPELRDEMYSAIGFERCDELVYPDELRSRKITNPDAPKNEHCIRLTTDGAQQWAVPVLFSRSPRYSPQRGGEFFSYLVFELMVVHRAADGHEVTPVLIDDEIQTEVPTNNESFFQQVGRNTNYLIHPEEILADNFAFLMMGKEDLPSQEIQLKLGRVLRSDRND